MIDIININVDENHYLRCPVDTIARDGEGNATQFVVDIPQSLSSYWVYFDFKMPNGEKFKTERLDLDGTKITYLLPPYLLSCKGELEAQLVLQNSDGAVWKSYVKTFNVRYSVNAADDIPEKEDFIREAQILLDEISNRSITVDDALSETSTNPVQNKVIVETLDDYDKAVNDKLDGVGNDIENLSNRLDGVRGNIENLSSGLGDVANDVDNLSNVVGGKQDVLVSGVSIKTINGKSVLGDGDIQTEIQTDDTLDASSNNPVQNCAVAGRFAEVDGSIDDICKNVENITKDIDDVCKSVEDIVKDIADLKYVTIKISDISNNVGAVEMGSTVNSVTITWSLNKTPVAQTVNGKGVDAGARSSTLDGLAIKTNTSFTVAATDERGATDTASTSITFLNGVYYGVLANGAAVDASTVRGLKKKLQSGKAITFTVDAASGQNVVYALPVRYGTPSFNVGGFDGGFSKVTTFDFTNASNYTESYAVWVSDNAGLGNTTVMVS